MFPSSYNLQSFLVPSPHILPEERKLKQNISELCFIIIFFHVSWKKPWQKNTKQPGVSFCNSYVIVQSCIILKKSSSFLQVNYFLIYQRLGRESSFFPNSLHVRTRAQVCFKASVHKILKLETDSSCEIHLLISSFLPISSTPIQSASLNNSALNCRTPLQTAKCKDVKIGTSYINIQCYSTYDESFKNFPWKHKCK